ncbi:hypothetical protein AB4Z21_28365, partial [Paenibacillus sp. MCAF20]
ATPILNLVSGADALQYRRKLQDTLDRLKYDHQSEDIREAKEVVEAATAALRSPVLFSSLVQSTVTETLGKKYGTYINDTDGYYALHAEEKPVEEVKVPWYMRE